MNALAQESPRQSLLTANPPGGQSITHCQSQTVGNPSLCCQNGTQESSILVKIRPSNPTVSLQLGWYETSQEGYGRESRSFTGSIENDLFCGLPIMSWLCRFDLLTRSITPMQVVLVARLTTAPSVAKRVGSREQHVPKKKL